MYVLFLCFFTFIVSCAVCVRCMFPSFWVLDQNYCHINLFVFLIYLPNDVNLTELCNSCHENCSRFMLDKILPSIFFWKCRYQVKNMTFVFHSFHWLITFAFENLYELPLSDLPWSLVFSLYFFSIYVQQQIQAMMCIFLL